MGCEVPKGWVIAYSDLDERSAGWPQAADFTQDG
jgi:hypothetical protein